MINCYVRTIRERWLEPNHKLVTNKYAYVSSAKKRQTIKYIVAFVANMTLTWQSRRMHGGEKKGKGNGTNPSCIIGGGSKATQLLTSDGRLLFFWIATAHQVTYLFMQFR